MVFGGICIECLCGNWRQAGRNMENIWKYVKRQLRMRGTDASDSKDEDDLGGGEGGCCIVACFPLA